MDKSVKTWEIVDALHGKRLDQVLTELSGLTRARVQQLLAQGCVRCSGKDDVVRKRSQRVLVGEVYHLDIPDTQPLKMVPEPIALDILLEDEHLLVINKPAGMVVHPSHGHDTGTLVHGLLHHCRDLPGINGIERPGIVHRLDKDTSGSLVVAKTEMAHKGLSELFAAHDLRREYVAWCRGFPRWLEKRIELPMGRHPQHRQKMAVMAKGKEAITDARVEHRFGENFCRLRLNLHTGRTHQIRVHLSYEGMPVLADAVYGRKFNPSKSLPEQVYMALKNLRRQALHAEILGFVHPITKENILCRAPLPPELADLDAGLSMLD